MMHTQGSVGRCLFAALLSLAVSQTWGISDQLWAGDGHEKAGRKARCMVWRRPFRTA